MFFSVFKIYYTDILKYTLHNFDYKKLDNKKTIKT